MQTFWQRIIDNKAKLLYFPFVLILWILSIFYRFGQLINSLFSGRTVKIGIPVISVGNLTVGGSGKTPVVIEIAKHLINSGLKVGIVSSGYGRDSQADFIALGKDIVKKDIDSVGDEILMMAGILPEVYFSVSKSKTTAASNIDSENTVDVIIVDDGFQHRRLHRDLNILLIDSSRNIFNESILPLGRLREPISELKQADYICLTKTNLAANIDDMTNKIESRINNIPISKIEFHNNSIMSRNDKLEIEKIKDKSIYFFAGIGNFGSAAKLLSKEFKSICGYRQFDDHCNYNEREINQIRSDVSNCKPDYILTTRKDFVKVPQLGNEIEIYYLDLELKFDSTVEIFFRILNKAARTN